jgi:uncharacterized LabA/DUF88 family protein
MSAGTQQTHRCYKCAVHDAQGPFRQQGVDTAPALDSLETTYAEGGDEIFFTSGYSAREIAQKRVREAGGRLYVNNISRSIKRRDLSYPVAYAVAKSPVFTLRAPDQWHDKVYRAYWPLL